MTVKARLTKKDELKSLLSLYKYLIPDDLELEVDERVEELWDEILNDPNLFYIVIEEDEKIVSSCTLAIIKNLTRSARPYGLIENVVTHPNYRNKGYGTAVLSEAVEICKYKGCYKVMLLTSSKDESILKFYENAGFDRGEKTGFIKRI
ncbi:MAG TPA: GNAT family N-acetyltransferase [Methanobacterium sp.]|nr:GNAT family N-acetyltransferase [Methanobacterium sp.]